MIPTDAPVPQAGGDAAQKPLQQQQENISDAPAALVSPPPKHSVVSREEKVEYRDQDGNLLDPEQVKALEGKVSFKTRYETRTRLVDAQGNEIYVEDPVQVAPPHPDVEGSEPETRGNPEVGVKDKPAVQQDVKADESKEQSIGKSDPGAAKPASEGNEATAK